MNDITKAIKDIQDDHPGMEEYTNLESESYKEMKIKIACILCN